VPLLDLSCQRHLPTLSWYTMKVAVGAMLLRSVRPQPPVSAGLKLGDNA
jgi:hypothetical protein